MKIKNLVIVFFAITFIFSSCTKEELEIEHLDAVNSASVAFAYGGDKLQNFFQNPSRAYISGYFYFQSSLAEDVIFGLDIEWTEGVDNPIHFEGADWMGLAGFTRNGILWFPIGSQENLSGSPTNTDLWEFRDIGTELEPNTWYKMTIETDFKLREFVSVKLEGNGLNIQEDISGYSLEYPNYIPFDKPSLTFYTFAIRSKEFAPNNEGGTKVYFDDIEGGILVDSDYQIVFSNGFENQTKIEQIPFTFPVGALDNVIENFWYFENDDAKIKIGSEIKRNGNNSIECNANLEK